MGIFLISLGVVLLVAIMAEKLAKKRRISNEVARKAIHITLGTALVLGYYNAGLLWLLVILVEVFIVVGIARLNGKFESFRHVRRKSYGEFYYLIGVGVAAIMAKSALVFAMAVLPLAYGDALAALIGKKFGKHKYVFLGQKKSFEGTVAFVLVALLVVVVPLVNGGYGIANHLSLIILLPAITGLAEAGAPFGLDNALIPILAAAIANSHLLG